MQRIRLVTLRIGDPDDVEIYAGAVCWEWSLGPNGRRIIEDFKIPMSQMYWTQSTDHNTYSIVIHIWTDVEPETAALLKLSGLCQLN